MLNALKNTLITLEYSMHDAIRDLAYRKQNEAFISIPDNCPDEYISTSLDILTENGYNREIIDNKIKITLNPPWLDYIYSYNIMPACKALELRAILPDNDWYTQFTATSDKTETILAFESLPELKDLWSISMPSSIAKLEQKNAFIWIMEHSGFTVETYDTYFLIKRDSSIS